MRISAEKYPDGVRLLDNRSKNFLYFARWAKSPKISAEISAIFSEPADFGLSPRDKRKIFFYFGRISKIRQNKRSSFAYWSY